MKKQLSQIERDKIINFSKKSSTLTPKQRLIQQARYKRNSKIDLEKLK
jgi:hypothetical protein